MHAIAEPSFEAVAVEQGHEELEVLVFAVMGGGRQQQEMSHQPRQPLTQAVAFGGFDLPCEERRRQLMGLIHDDEIPIGLFERGLDVLVAAQLVQAADGQGVFQEPVARAGCFQGIRGHDLERTTCQIFKASHDSVCPSVS